MRAVSPPFLANHSLRCYAWAVALADRDRVRFDAELLYVAAALHDLGLVPEYDKGGCFEDDGADAAAALAAEEAWPPERREALAEAIKLHMAVDVALDDGPEAYLLWHSTSLDVSGSRFGELEPRLVENVVAQWPRLDFKQGFTRLFEDQAERKPHCRAAELVRGGIAARIAAMPLA